MRATSWVLGAMMIAVLVSGCSTTRQQEAMSTGESVYNPPTSIYSILDSTSLVYSDPAAGAVINDSPFRWVAFILHPIGQAVDYGFNRPLYGLGSLFPYVMGYTPEDNMLDAQRR
jgi:hypothetical protein